MKMKKIFTMTLVLMMMITIVKPAHAANEIKVIVDGKEMETNTSPITTNGRTLVPFRTIFENLGAKDIQWIAGQQAIKATINDRKIELRVNNTTAYVDGKTIQLDTAPIIDNGRTFVPIRFVAESTGRHTVDWVQKTKEVRITTKEESKKIVNINLNKEITLGENVSNITSKFGEPVRKDKSEEGFTWFIYNKDLTNYFQVGILNDEVIAFVSNSANWAYKDFKIGQNNKKFLEEENHFNVGGYSVIVFMDTITNTISGISITDDKAKSSIQYTDEVVKSHELQYHDLTNVFRVREGLKPLELKSELTDLAKSHSKDMAGNDFYSHTSPTKGDLEKRAKRFCGTHYGIAENITGVYDNAIAATNGLYNSPGHRRNILNAPFAYSGVGFAIDSTIGKTAYTQAFSR